MLGCRDCTNLETLVLALARRLHDLEQRLAEVERRLHRLHRLHRLTDREPGALTFAVRRGQNGSPRPRAVPGEKDSGTAGQATPPWGVPRTKG